MCSTNCPTLLTLVYEMRVHSMKQWMANGSNGHPGQTAPYPAQMEPNIGQERARDRSMTAKIVPATTLKLPAAFQRSVLVSFQTVNVNVSVWKWIE